MAKPSEGKVLAALLVVQVLFGGLGVAAKLVFPYVPPLALALCRLAAGAAILFALERMFVRSPMPTRRDIAAFALFALLGVALNQGLYLAGLEKTTATNAILLIATIPAFTLLVAVAMRRETTRPLTVAGLLLSFAGIFVLVSGSGVDLAGASVVGDLMVVANALCYSIYLVISRPHLARHDPLTLISWVFLLGTVEMSIVAVPALLTADWGGMTAVSWGAFAYVIVCGSVMTYGLNTWALRHASASRVASFVYLQPVVGAFLAWLILDEPLGWRVFGAAALIFAGVALANRASFRPRARNPAE